MVGGSLFASAGNYIVIKMRKYPHEIDAKFTNAAIKRSVVNKLDTPAYYNKFR